MESDRWQRLWTLFHDALERAAGAEREAYVRTACGADEDLRRELDSLLAAHLSDDASIRPNLLDVAPTIAFDAPAGTQIGPYRIVRKIGEGGMGQVYEALQEAPVQRRVALKLIKLGMDTREVVRRFEVERQVLARMDHSSIARVFDAGATPEGRPYFAMELVDGPALADYCDARRLPIPARLELFATVCHAVHSAHQKGVIHRDIKAGNVLVAAEEGRPIPKVIDFGIARAIDPGLSSDTLATRFGQLVGTPSNMSPEQAAMSLDLDTRTDIYSLGALLYELLTGCHAFEFRDTPFPEILRRIRDEDPPLPSSRFGADTADARGRAECRGSEPARLRRELSGELDWIIARAMAKERERRYGSAAELAQDLERYLHDQPVSAGPPGGLYRLRKFLRRHRAEAAAATIVLAALVAFGVAMAVQSRRLAAALAQQEQERRTTNRVAEFLVEILEQPDPAVARGADVSVREVLDRGAARIEQDLGEQPEIQARLLSTIGRVFLNLGAFEQAAPVLERALALQRGMHGADHADVAAALGKLGELDFERASYASSRQFAVSALAMRRRLLPPGDPAIAESLDLVALLERQAGRLDAAEQQHREALEIRLAALGADDPAVAESHNYLGIARRWRGDFAGAEAEYRLALGIWRRAFGDDHPKVAMALNNLALVLHVRGDLAGARRIFDELLPLRRRLLGPDHPDLQVTLANYAKLLHDSADLTGAERVYREALAVGERTLGPEHPLVAAALADFAAVLAKLGKLDEALAAAERALAIRRRVHGEEHRVVAASYSYLGEVVEARGDRIAAERYFVRALEILRRAPDAQLDTGQALEKLGRFHLRGGDRARALPLLEEAVALLRSHLPAADRRLARAEVALGSCLMQYGRLDESAALLEGAVARLAGFETEASIEARAQLAALRAARARPGRSQG